MPSFLRMEEMAANKEARRMALAKRAKEDELKASCNGKRKYESFTLANKSTTRGVEIHSHGRRLMAYKCRLCGGYHLGNTIPKLSALKKSKKKYRDRDI